MGKRESKKKRSEEKEDDQAKMVGLFDDLAKVSRDIEKANHELQKKLRRVERDYNSHRRPLWEQRSKIINQIDEFYAHVLTEHEMVSAVIRESDMPLLNKISDITVSDEATGENVIDACKITFHFKPNDHIEDAQLWKKIEVDKSGDISISQSGIKWKAGKNLVELALTLVKQEEEKQNEGDDAAVKRSFEEDQRSFFSFFEEEEQEADRDLFNVLKEEVFANPLEIYSRMFATYNGDDDGAIHVEATAGEGSEDNNN